MFDILNFDKLVLLWTIVLVAMIVVPLVLIYYMKNDEYNVLLKYRNIFPTEEEAIEAYNRDKLNIQVPSNEKVRSIIMIASYAFIFFILATVIQYIAIFIYLGVHNYSYEIIVEGSEIFSQEVFDHMSNVLNVVLQVVIYVIILVAAIIICGKIFLKDLKKFKGKYIGYAAMGFGLVYAGSFIGSRLLTLLQVTENKSDATNQEAINAMFSQGPAAILALFVVTVLIAPIVEEIVFRKCIFNLFKDKKMGLYVSTIAFGLLHVISPLTVVFVQCLTHEADIFDLYLELMYIIPYSLMGLGMGIAYMKSNNNIIAPILTHTANNLISFIISLLMVMFPQLLELFIAI